MFDISNDVRLLGRVATRRTQTRAEIVGAAWQLARRNGLAGITMRDLAAEVGMKAPSLYTYFDSKHEIYDAMFAEGYRSFVALMAEPPPGRTPQTKVIAGLTRYFEFATSDPERFQLLFLRTIPGFEPSPESYALAIEAFETLAQELAGVGVTDRRDVDMWAALATGLASQQIANPDDHRWPPLIKRAARALLPATSNLIVKER